MSEIAETTEEQEVIEVIDETAKQEIMQALAITPEQDEFGLMDRYDEQMIISDIKTSIDPSILEAWVYKTRNGGKEVTYNAIRHWSNVRTQKGYPIDVSEATQIDFSDKIREILEAYKAGIYTDAEAKEKVSFYTDNIFVQVKATDVSTQQGRLGFAEQPIKDKGKTDSFAFRKACGKAQRNAIREFMTAEEKAALIFMAETQGRPTVQLQREKPLNQTAMISTGQFQKIKEQAPKERLNKYLKAKGYSSLNQVTYKEAVAILNQLKEGE